MLDFWSNFWGASQNVAVERNLVDIKETIEAIGIDYDMDLTPYIKETIEYAKLNKK